MLICDYLIFPNPKKKRKKKEEELANMYDFFKFIGEY